MDVQQHKVIYFRDKSLHIISKSELQNFASDGVATYIWSFIDGKLSVANIIKIFDKYERVVYSVDDDRFDDSYNELISEFKCVSAAGGIVENGTGDVLMIRCRDRWDLPKGHIEPNESAEECAVREIAEETGVGANIAAFLCNTLHAYNVYGEWELKTTYWYWLSSSGKCRLMPQESEGIECAEWCNAETLGVRLSDTYPTIRAVFEKYEKLKCNR